MTKGINVETTEVLIAGAGPSGSVGAARLASMGIDVMICEAEDACAHDLRASTIHSVTLEMLDEIDAAEPLIDLGLKSPVYQWRDRRTNEYLEFDLSEIADHTKFPFRLQCEQHFMSKLLTERLPTLKNADVRFGTKLIRAEQDAEGVTATLLKDGVETQVRAKFLIGADGSHSVVRKQIGVEFSGFTYDEKFLSLSTVYPIEDVLTDIAWVNYISDPEEWLVLKVPALWRILVPADVNDSDELLKSDARAAEVFNRIVPGVDVETAHRTIYRVHQRVAETFVKDRILLIGDAAHLNNPLGGFGMNSGIHDAWNLADKLWKILRKDGGRDLLGLFDRQRRQATHDFIQAQTIANKAFMEQGQGEMHESRLARMRAMAADPVARREYLLTQAMFKSLEDAEKIQ
jgi:3-(3-hydroxy-phenyl)propionate hydroxylase